MTYLTQVIVDFATAARLPLRDSYAWHQAVWNAFPGRADDKRDFLTRIDRQREGFRLLIVSATAPTRPNWCAPDEESWRTKVVPDTYFSRTKYVFQLCVNPTKKVAKLNPDGTKTKNGKRVPLRTREEMLAWISRKGEQGGFSVDLNTLRTYSRGREYFLREGASGLHSAVEYAGILAVTDPVAFYRTFTHGIGSAKAFGFGLLVIAPLKQV